MRHFKPVLNRKGLLVAAVALGSGTAFAETAGRVNFVSGAVTVTPASGGSRVLQRGDLINGGDRISTNAGRVQIRFSDGGFVSLQPGTIFGVDEYLYANRKPEETSVFFNLVQGGMRTVTGLIGKVNKQSYKVRTPVATIGIRGTEYLAQMNEDGLRVSVGAGFVVTENNAGSVTAGPGQNLHVPDADSTPELSEEAPLLQATGVDGDAQEVAEENSQDSSTRRDIRAGDLDPTFASPTGPQQIVTPSGGVLSGYVTTFDGTGLLSVTPSASQGPSVGGFFVAPIMSVTEGGTSPVAVDALFERGSLKVVNAHSEGGLRWGEFTDGESDVNVIFQYQGQSGVLTLGENDFLPYLAGTPLSNGYIEGTATYTLQGGTARNANGAAGTLNTFNLTYDFASNLANVLLEATLPNTSGSGSTTYTASDSGLLTSLSTNGVFHFNSISTTASDFITCSAGCTTTIDAFFSGHQNAQVGAGYAITSGSSTIGSGVAALGQSSYTPPNPTGPAVHQIASVTHDAVNNQSIVSVATDGTATLDSEGGLLTVKGSSGSTIFDRGTWNVVNAGHAAHEGNMLNWGEFMNGTSSVDHVFLNGPGTLSGNMFVPWIVGAPLSNGYTSGTATYALQDGTARGYGEGTLDSFSLVYRFDSNMVDVALQATVAINDTTQRTYVAGGSNIASGLNSAGVFNLSNIETVSTDIGDACNSGGCRTNISAFFSGNENAQIGASYAILNAGGGEIAAGVAALGKMHYDPANPYNAVAYAHSLHGAALLAGDYSSGHTLELTNDVDGALLSALGSAPYAELDRSGITEVAVDSRGTAGALNWGRWYTNTSAYVSAGEGELPLGSDGGPSLDLHYIAGTLTKPSDFASITSAHGTGATATYSYAGGTTATGSDGRTGTLSGSLAVAFTAAPTLSANLALTMNDSAVYSMSGSGFAINSSRFVANGPDLTCTGGANGCDAGLSGFFVGPQAAQVGLSYSVYDYDKNHYANGAAAFTRGSISGTGSD